MKFKNLLIILALSMSSLALADHAFVDMEKILLAYSKTDSIKAEYDVIDSNRKQLLKQLEFMAQDIQKSAQELDKLKKDLEKNKDSWSDEKYDNEKQKIAAKSKNFVDQRRRLESDRQKGLNGLQQQHRELKQKMINEIREKISDYAKGKKLDAVYYTEATAYWNPKFEITAEIIQVVNPGYKEETEEKKDKKEIKPGK